MAAINPPQGTLGQREEGEGLCWPKDSVLNCVCFFLIGFDQRDNTPSLCLSLILSLTLSVWVVCILSVY